MTLGWKNGFGARMKYQYIFLFHMMSTCISFALDSGRDSHHDAVKVDNKTHKELTRANSNKSRHFLSRPKKEKRESDDGMDEISTYEELLALATNSDVTKLKSSLAKHPKAILLADENGNNIIHRFISQNNIKLLTAVVTSVPPDIACQAINTRNSSTIAPLHIAASSGAHAVAIYLLSKGAWVDLPGPSTITAYIMAIHKQDVHMAYILAAFGAQVNSAPLGDQQQLISKIKLFSSLCREFFIDVFVSKNTATFDKSFVALLLEHIDNSISETYRTNMLKENLEQFDLSPNDESEETN